MSEVYWAADQCKTWGDGDVYPAAVLWQHTELLSSIGSDERPFLSYLWLRRDEQDSHDGTSEHCKICGNAWGVVMSVFILKIMPVMTEYCG